MLPCLQREEIIAFGKYKYHGQGSWKEKTDDFMA